MLDLANRREGQMLFRQGDNQETVGKTAQHTLDYMT